MLQYGCFQVYKTAQTHYFSIEKAKKDLHYNPEYQNDLSAVAQHYKSLRLQREAAARGRWTKLLVDICLVIIAIMFFFSFLPSAK